MRKMEVKRAVKKVLKDLPFHEESPRKVRPTDMKTQQLQFLLRGLNFIKAPIVASSLAQQCFGLGWEGWKNHVCLDLFDVACRLAYLLKFYLPILNIR